MIKNRTTTIAVEGEKEPYLDTVGKCLRISYFHCRPRGIESKGLRPAINAKSQIPRKDVLVLFNVSCEQYVVRFPLVRSGIAHRAIEELRDGAEILFNGA